MSAVISPAVIEGDGDLELDVHDLAYIAGLVDGEGCITINYRADKGCFTPHFGISIDDAEVLKWVKNLLNAGWLLKRWNKGYTKTHWCLVFGVKATKRVLPKILPYMKTKRNQAKLLLEFLAYRRLGANDRLVGYRRKIEEFFRQMRVLNHG